MVVVVLLVLGASLEQADRDRRAATARHCEIYFFIFGILDWLTDGVKVRAPFIPRYGV